MLASLVLALAPVLGASASSFETVAEELDRIEAAKGQAWVAEALPALYERALSEGADAPVLDRLSDQLVLQLQRDRRIWWSKAYERNPETGEVTALPDAPPEPSLAYVPRFERLASAGSCTARLWLLTKLKPKDDRERQVLEEQLVASVDGCYDAGSARRIIRSFRNLVDALGADVVEPQARKLAERADEDMRPSVHYYLGNAMIRSGVAAARSAETLRGLQAEGEIPLPPDHQGLLDRGLALMREVQERWPDTKAGRRASGKLFFHTRLSPGQVVPDYEAVDVDGNPVRLSDYRGKVTVLDFWGFW